MAKWRHRYARINGLHTHYVEQGQGPLVVLAHGFPHTWFSWRHQIPVIAEAGFRVIAPDLRGMGQTDTPRDPAAYDCEHTAGDLAALLDHLGEARAVFWRSLTPPPDDPSVWRRSSPSTIRPHRTIRRARRSPRARSWRASIFIT